MQGMETQVTTPVKAVTATDTQKLTFKQRKWMKHYLLTGSATEAAMIAYDCSDRKVAGTIGWENLKKLDFCELLERGGVTDAKLVGALNEMLVAKRTDDADYLTRSKAVETALKLKKRLDAKEEKDKGTSINFMNSNVQIINYKDAGKEDNNTSVSIPAQTLPTTTS